MNNHRQRLNHTCNLFLYQQFCSSGHSEDDIPIMPIEEVSLEEGEYWYKELATIYSYGLNDNVKNLGNISKKDTEKITKIDSSYNQNFFNVPFHNNFKGIEMINLSTIIM